MTNFIPTQFVFNIFLVSVFFFKIPSLYIFPFFHNSLFTTQSLGRLALVTVLLFLLVHSFITKKPTLSSSAQKILVLLVLLFAIQSLSFFYAVDTLGFLRTYKDIFIGVVAFVVFAHYRDSIKLIVNTILIGMGVNIAYQLILISNHDLLKNLLSQLVYEEHFKIVLRNIERGRIFVDFYDEIFAAVIFYRLTLIKKNIKYYLLLLGVNFFAFVSNVRSRALMLLFSSILGVLLLIKKIKTHYIIFLTILIATVIIASSLGSSIFGFSLLERLTLQDKHEDVNTVTNRFEQIALGFSMGSLHWTGAGLGNFYLHLPVKLKNSKSLFQKDSINSTFGIEQPHNIFAAFAAESGYISLLIFIIILSYFAYSDLHLIKTNNAQKITLVIAFWSLFTYGLFNPVVPASYQVFFWGLRGLLAQ